MTAATPSATERTLRWSGGACLPTERQARRSERREDAHPRARRRSALNLSVQYPSTPNPVSAVEIGRRLVPV